jgi:hypothetical protein
VPNIAIFADSFLAYAATDLYHRLSPVMAHFRAALPAILSFVGLCFFSHFPFGWLSEKGRL